MHYKLLHKFLQTIKCCFQVQVQATSLLKRNKHWNAFRVWLYEKHLVHLCGYPTHQGSRKKSLWKKNPETLNLTLSLTWHRCGKNPPGKNPWELFSGGGFFPDTVVDIKSLSFLFCIYMIMGKVEMKIMQMRMYQFKITKSLFLSRCEHVSCLGRWNRLYIDTKTILSQTAYGDIFPI